MYLRLTQVAARLGVATGTIRRWIDTGKLPAILLPTTGERRVSEQAVADLQAQMVARGTTRPGTKGGSRG
jgi:excisionase family DNA binding protein